MKPSYKLLVTGLIIGLLVITMGVVNARQEDPTLLVNDQAVTAEMYIEEGKTWIEGDAAGDLLGTEFPDTYVPLREVFEGEQADVHWDRTTRTIEIKVDLLREEESALIEDIDVDRALENVRVLSEEIGTRPAGSDHEHQAAEFIYDYYQDLGYDVALQEFPVDFAGPGSMGLADVTVVDGSQWFGEIEIDHETEYGDDYEWGVFESWHGTEWEMGASPQGLITEEPLCGQVIDAGTGEEDAFPEDVEGNIALVQMGGVDHNQVVENALEAGAEGVIIFSGIGGRGNLGQAFTPVLEEEVDIPVLGAAKVHGAWLLEILEQEPVELCIDTYYNEDLISYNVEAVKAPEGEDAPILAVTGHYDSVIGAPGANDNASGTAAAMELARVLADYDGDVELRFINFGAEEVGLVGSRYYVDQLTEEEKDRFIGMYNPDMVATSDPYIEHLFVQTVDGEPNHVTESMVAADRRLGYGEVETGLFPASDHVPFHEAGIDAAVFIHLAGEGTPQNYYIEPVYHTPQDTLEDNICPDRYEKALEIIGSAVFDTIH